MNSPHIIAVAACLFSSIFIIEFDVASAFVPSLSSFSRERIRSVSFLSRSSAVAPQNSASNDEMMPLCGGSYVALVTPFSSDGSIDFAALRSLLQFHVSSNTNGICLLGTTAETAVLTNDEQSAVLSVAVEECKGVLPILMGTGAIDPAKIKENTQRARDGGADGALLVTPPYVKPPQRALVKLFSEMADVGLPTILYNVPSRTGVDLLPQTVLACQEAHDNIVGIKDATGNVLRAKETRELVGDKFLMLSGDDETTMDFIDQGGGDGAISVTANVAPLLVSKMIRLALDGKMDDAARTRNQLTVLNNKLFVESNPIPVKWAVARMGKINSPYCRMPLDELDSIYHKEVEEALEAAGIRI